MEWNVYCDIFSLKVFLVLFVFQHKSDWAIPLSKEALSLNKFLKHFIPLSDQLLNDPSCIEGKKKWLWAIGLRREENPESQIIFLTGFKSSALLGQWVKKSEDSK